MFTRGWGQGGGTDGQWESEGGDFIGGASQRSAKSSSESLPAEHARQQLWVSPQSGFTHSSVMVFPQSGSTITLVGLTYLTNRILKERQAHSI